MVGNEQGRFPGFMENVVPSDSYGGCNSEAVSNKKRPRFEMRSQTSCTSDRATGAAKHNEVLMLKAALKSERDTLQKLYEELEEERNASMTAANEAMGMIARLHEEKAAVLMEACQYRRLAEERETHNQEAIGLLKEALLTKEDDLLALQNLLNSYREAVLGLESEHRRHQCRCLEGDNGKEGLLYLEGPKYSISIGNVSYDATHIGQDSIVRTTEMCRADNSHEDSEYQHGCLGTHHNDWCMQDLNIPGPFDDFGEIFDQRDFEGVSEERSKDRYSVWQSCKDTRQGKDTTVEAENETPSWGQSVEDVSASIFARVKRLEERFEHLRQSQALDSDTYIVACQSHASDSNNREPEELTRPNRVSALKALSNSEQPFNMESGRDSVDVACGEPEEILKCLLFEKVRRVSINEDQERQLSESGGGTGFEQRRNKRAIHEELSSVNKSVDDVPESVRDVYEVQIETKRPIVPLPGQNLKAHYGRDRSKVESMEMEVLSKSSKESLDGFLPVPGNETEVCTALDNKLSVEISSLDAKGARTDTAREEVEQLKVRLQALEGERIFMKDAIESLRKENRELRVLQDIAQQLQDLKGNVRKTRQVESLGQHCYQPFFSFFKGIFSFNGSPNSSPTGGSRSLMRSRASPGTGEQGGLLHILNNTEKSVCVLRERKVNISSPHDKGLSYSAISLAKH